MKKYLFLISMIFATANIYSQNFQISFAGTGAATTIDSVKVQNLTQGTSLTLSGIDVLHLSGTTGINNLNGYRETLLVYPNPMQGQAELSFYAKQTGNTQVTIFNISGKEVLQICDKLSKGIQKYQIAGLKQGMYFINVSSESYFYRSKLISLNTTQSEVIMEYLGSENPEAVTSTFKNTKSTVDMAYKTGDRLLFKGISGDYSTIITDVPTASKTLTFNFVACTDTDENNYSVVKIGTQTWMAENLNVAKYRNGNIIPNVTDNTQWGSLTTGAYCDYDNTPANSVISGKLYNWYTVVDTRNICPTGWHLPTDAEWTILTDYLTNNGYGYQGSGPDIAKSMAATWSWMASTTIGTPGYDEASNNSSGFTALQNGYRHINSTFTIGAGARWWSSDEFNATDANYLAVAYLYDYIIRNNLGKAYGFSVRCLKD